MGQTVGALEATPKIWDMAAAWLVLSELGCPLIWLDRQPSDLVVGEDLASADFPVVVASNEDMLERLHEWGQALVQ